jgi:DNA-nicking Smr family endonuclease
MESSKEIGDFGRATRKDGGSGATWFILRQRSL